MTADANFRPSHLDEDKKSYDVYAHARTVIGEDHRIIHDGGGFTCTDVFTSLANGASKEYILVSGVSSAVYPHLRKCDVNTEDGPFDLYIYEEATVSDYGNALTPVNNNRNVGTAPISLVYDDPTVTGTGTQLQVHRVFSTGAPGQANGVAASNQLDNEFLLKPQTITLFRITNNSGAAIDGHFHIFWYEIPSWYEN